MSKTVAIPGSLERFLELLFQCGDELDKIHDDLPTLSKACSLIDNAVEGWFATISSELVRMKRTEFDEYNDALDQLSDDEKGILFVRICDCQECKKSDSVTIHERFQFSDFLLS